MKEITAYKVGEQVFPTIQEAQKSELIALFSPWPNGIDEPHESLAATAVLAHLDEVVAILTCQPKSTPRKPRSDIGKKRAVKGATPPAL